MAVTHTVFLLGIFQTIFSLVRKKYVAIFSCPLQGGLAMGGPEALECEDEALYGREYLDWKKQTLDTQVGVAAAEINEMLN